jgi:hypothetical protein
MDTVVSLAVPIPQPEMQFQSTPNIANLSSKSTLKLPKAVRLMEEPHVSGIRSIKHSLHTEERKFCLYQSKLKTDCLAD